MDPLAVDWGNGGDLQYISKSFDQWRDVLDWNVKKQNKQKNYTIYCGAGGALAQVTLLFYCDDTAA